VLESGFVGVKIYPPMGFRPRCNEELHGPEGARLDEALNRLYAFCVEHDVPLTAHCTEQGAQAAPTRGRNSHPRFWELVLADYPDLRLNLGHFGGAWELVRDDFDASWTADIIRLMEGHEHVYSDVGYHRIWPTPARPEGKTEKTRNAWFARMDRLYEEHPRLARRLMYGSDWHMTVATEQVREYFGSFREAWLARYGAEATADFMGGNALRFLGLGPDGGGNRGRLTSFYARLGLAEPAWFRTARP